MISSLNIVLKTSTSSIDSSSMCSVVLLDKDLKIMPFLKVWIHAVWSTELRKPLLESSIRGEVFLHIKENGIKKGIYIDRVNGFHDHVHVLFDLPSEISIAKVIQLIKGESSFWINRSGLIRHPFAWQSEYYAASVSDRAVDEVRHYIDHQEQHHQAKSFATEYDELMDHLKNQTSSSRS